MKARARAPKDWRRAFAGKTVLVTGHTGFKGSWLSLMLHDMGARVVGYALAPDTRPSLFKQLRLDALVDSRLGDIRDAKRLCAVARQTKPEVVFHLAAQPLVRRSYKIPAETFAVNVCGTAHALDAARLCGARAVVAVTTDKCYENLETGRAYLESDRLGGHDPYSASKACAELTVASYRDSFFSAPGEAAVATARAGNVIGGGDWADDRILPDAARALGAGKALIVRNPNSVRPWQHVLEPLTGYLMLAARLLSDGADFAEAWNFGPVKSDALTVAEIAELAVKTWGGGRWQSRPQARAPHEAGLLSLDSDKARRRLGWKPVYGAALAVEKTVAWYRAARERGFDARAFTRAQIAEYLTASTARREDRS